MMPNDPKENVSPESIAEITATLNELEASVGPLVTLTPEEREEARANYEKMKEMIEGGFEIPSDHPDLADPESDLSKLNAQILRMKLLDGLRADLEPLKEIIVKTYSDSEKNALLKAYHYYASLELSAKAGVPGAEEAYRELKGPFDELMAAIHEVRANREAALEEKSPEKS